MAGLELLVKRRIPVPQERAWQVVSNIAAAADTIEAISKVEVLGDGPIGVGTRFTESRMLFRRESTETMEITLWEPPLRYVVEADSCGAHFLSEIRCESDGDDATILSMSMDSTPTSVLARLLRPIGRLMLNSMRKMLEKDLDDISRACLGENDAQPSDDHDMDGHDGDTED